MTHVTPSTARALKAAGFPQPTPKKGQKWESPNGISYTLEGESDTYYTANSPCLFIPTTEDILQKFSSAWYYLCWLPESSGWACIEADSYGRTLRQYRNTNAAEACASAYLALHPTPAP